MLPGAIGISLHVVRTLPPSWRLLIEAAAEPPAGRNVCHNIPSSAAITSDRNAHSPRARISAREGIADDVHAEACVVDSRESLGVRRIIPLRAVILAAV